MDLDWDVYGPLVGCLVLAVGWLAKQNRSQARELRTLHAQWRLDLIAASKEVAELMRLHESSRRR